MVRRSLVGRWSLWRPTLLVAAYYLAKELFGYFAIGWWLCSTTSCTEDPGFIQEEPKEKDLAFEGGASAWWTFWRSPTASPSVFIFDYTVLKFDTVTCFAVVAMASVPPTTSSSTGGIPLQEFRRDIPPGWIPGGPQLPLKDVFRETQVVVQNVHG